MYMVHVYQVNLYFIVGVFCEANLLFISFIFVLHATPTNSTHLQIRTNKIFILEV